MYVCGMFNVELSKFSNYFVSTSLECRIQIPLCLHVCKSNKLSMNSIHNFSL